MSETKGICILGSTGTIGVNTLDVISRHPQKFAVIALTAHRNVAKLSEQCLEYQPKYAVMVDEKKAQELQQNLSSQNCPTEVLVGTQALSDVASLNEVDYVMAAIVGAAGLLPNLAAAKAGKRVMLANKESLVMSGSVFMDAVAENNAELLPIDSEHNAIFQAMPAPLNGCHAKQGVSKILLTGSGGPFRTRAIATLADVTPDEAVAHPNWVMGKKISVDSATMMNKGLELIEACWLFDVGIEQIDVIIHPQSTVHSMVAYVDGSVLAQLGNPDMRTPIAYALAYPERIDAGVEPLDMIAQARLDFTAPDYARYPCLQLAMDAHQAGGYSSIALNAANEVAVDAFLRKQTRFTEIPRLIEHAMRHAPTGTPEAIDDILAQDSASRKLTIDLIKSISA